MYDNAGKRTSVFTTDRSFSGLEISNSGLAAGYCENRMKTGGLDYLRIYGQDGALVHQIDGRFMWPMSPHVRFSPDGNVVAVLESAPVKPRGRQPVAILLDKEREILSHPLTESYSPSDVQLASEAPRVAFAVHKFIVEQRKMLNEIHVYDAADNVWHKTVPDDLGMVLTRNTVALSEDGRTLYVGGLGIVHACDATTGKSRWRRQLSHGKNKPDIAVQVSLVGANVIAAHRVPAAGGDSYRYLMSFLDVKHGDVRRSFLTEERPYPQKVPPLWYASPDGRSILLNLGGDQKRIALPSAVR